MRFLERISAHVLADPTKIQRSIQVLKKHCDPNEWKDSFEVLMESMAVSLLSGDAVADDFSVDFLVPKARRLAGYVQGVITKRKFFKWFMEEQLTTAASGATSVLSTSGLMAIKDKCSSPRIFWWNFHDDGLVEDSGSCHGQGTPFYSDDIGIPSIYCREFELDVGCILSGSRMDLEWIFSDVVGS